MMPLVIHVVGEIHQDLSFWSVERRLVFSCQEFQSVDGHHQLDGSTAKDDKLAGRVDTRREDDLVAGRTKG